MRTLLALFAVGYRKRKLSTIAQSDRIGIVKSIRGSQDDACDAVAGGSCFTLRTLRSGGSCFTLRSLRSGGSRLTLRSLRSGCSRFTLRSLRSGGSCFTLRSLRSGCSRFTLRSLLTVGHSIFLISTVSIIDSICIYKSLSTDKFDLRYSVTLIGNESKVELVFFSVEIISIFLGGKRGRNIFYGHLASILIEIEHGNHSVLWIVIIIGGIWVIPIERLRINEKLGYGISTVSLALKHKNITVSHIGVVTAEHKEYISVLAHELLPHFNTVVSGVISNGIGRIRLIVKSAAVR